MRSKLTYSNVISTLCLFLLLAGGTAFAASQLGKNTVGTKQLKKNAVNGTKVKDQSLTGKDINLAKLGTVPSATNAANATTAGTASALTPPEAIHLIGAPGQPSFQNGASNIPQELGVNFQPAGFYKDHEGIVHLEGDVKLSSKAGQIFTLPPGFRPAANTVQGFQPGKETVLIVGSGVNISELLSEGAVYTSGENEDVALSGITFRPGS